MADISTELQAILSAVYGEEVRGSIYDAIEKINEVSEVVISTGTAISNETDSVEGYYEGSLYLNTQNQYLWKCNGLSWDLIAQLKGIQGDRGQKGTSVESLIDNEDGTFKLGLSDGTTTNSINLLKGDKGDTGATGASGANGTSILSFVDRPSGAIHNIWAQMSDGSERLVGSISDGIVEGGDGDMKKSVYAALDTDNRGIVDKALTLNDGTRNVSIDYVTNKADKSTSLAGYGITNAYTKSEVDALVGSSAATWSNVTGKPFITVGNDFSTSGNILLLSNNNKNLIKGISSDDYYRSDRSYVAGRICIKNNRVFRSLVDNNSGNDPEESNSAYWVETSLGEEINNTIYSGNNVLTTTNTKVSLSAQSAIIIGRMCFVYAKISFTKNTSFAAGEVIATLNSELAPKNNMSTTMLTMYGADDLSSITVKVNQNGTITINKATTMPTTSYGTFVFMNMFWEVN